MNKEHTPEKLLDNIKEGLHHPNFKNAVISAMKQYAKQEASKAWDMATTKIKYGAGYPDKEQYLSTTFP